MIEFLLYMPRRPEDPPYAPRREVRVWMVEDDPERVGAVLVSGEEERHVRAVREALFEWATVFRGARLDPKRAAPRDLAVAMRSEAMRPLSPRRVDGGPALTVGEGSVEDALRGLGSDVAALLTGALPRLRGTSLQALGEFVEQLRWIVARSRGLAASELPDDAMSWIAVGGAEALEAVGITLAELEDVLPSELVVLQDLVLETPQASVEITAVLQTLAGWLRARADSDLRSATDEVWRAWTGEGLSLDSP